MTIPKWFSKRPRLQRTIKAIVIFAFVSAWLFRPSAAACADSAPDWFRAAAQEKLPEYPKETEAVILLDELITTVRDKGEIETRHRRVYKLLRPESVSKYGAMAVTFDGDTKLTYLKAWTITPDGIALEVKEADAVELSFTTFELYNGVRVKSLRFPEAKPGSVVGYEQVRKQRPYVFDSVWTFQDLVPIHRSRFYLELPNGWEFKTSWANHEEQKPLDQSTNHYLWEVLESPAIEVEPEMPPLPAVQGRMYVKYYPRDPAMRAKSAGTWKELGLWYWALTGDSRTATPAIQQKVAELTSGISGQLERMKTLAAYVQ